MTIFELLEKKRKEVVLYREDFFAESDSPGWMDRHRLGPVHIQITCRLCGKVLADDLPEYGWIERDSYYKSHLAPHLKEHI